MHIMRSLANEGKSILFICCERKSKNTADRCTVLRKEPADPERWT